MTKSLFPFWSAEGLTRELDRVPLFTRLSSTEKKCFLIALFPH